MKIQATIVFEKNWDAIHAKDTTGGRQYRYIINKGSSRSSKTWSLLECYNLYAGGNPNKRMTVWRDTKKDCKDTVLQDFLKMLRETNRFNRDRFNKTESIYTYPSGSAIEINGTDDEEKVHGLSQQVAWFNEPYKISRETFNQIDQRTEDFIFIDYNPKMHRHWVDDLMKHPRSIVIHSTFKDNPFCPAESRAKILSYEPLPDDKKHLIKKSVDKIPAEYLNAWHNEKNGTASKLNWAVYGLGIKGEIEGRILKFEVEPLPEGAKLYGYGADYGYANDPTTVIGLYTHNNRYYFDEIIYEPGLNPANLGAMLKKNGITGNDLIIMDRSAALVIDEVAQLGFYIHPAKGDTSIIYGLEKMQESIPIFTPRSLNLIREAENYHYAKDVLGNWTNTPEKNQSDHAIDAARYIITDCRTARAIY